jgi:hypothetical protein
MAACPPPARNCISKTNRNMGLAMLDESHSVLATIRREGIPRRGLVAMLAAAPALGMAAAPGPARAQSIDEAAARVQEALRNAKGTQLVLLGTGAGPVAGQARRMASHLMLHNGAAYVLDCGLGVSPRNMPAPAPRCARFAPSSSPTIIRTTTSNSGHS